MPRMDRVLYAAILILLVLLLFATGAGYSAENEAWETNPPEVREWFQNLKQPDNPLVSCCGEADAYWADSYKVRGDQYIAIITDTRKINGRTRVDPGTEILVPNYKIKHDDPNPTGHGLIFISRGDEPVVYCYLPPGGV